jgi:nucleoside-diphosphate-sugar epimerase
MRVVILGGAGLLGSELYGRLVALGHEVAIVDNFSGSLRTRVPKDRHLYALDVTDLNSFSHVFKTFKPEAVYVAVNYFFNYRDTIYKIFNETRLILNTANNVAALLGPSVKEVYYCSSSEVYGLPNPKKPVKESRKIIGCSNLRGTAFKAAEDIISHRCRDLGIRFVSFRIFDLYGPRIKHTPVTGRLNFLIESFQAFEQIGLSGPKDKRDFIHCNDAADIIAATSSTDFNGVMNVGTGRSTTLLSLCDTIAKNMEIVYPPVPLKNSAGAPCVADTSLCEKVTGIIPNIRVENCIEELIKFRRKETEFYSSANSANILKAQRGL